jgi:hypothetical protein
MRSPGPSIKFHGGNSAYSFARDIRFNLFHVYLASEALAKTVRTIAKKSNKQLGCFAAANGADAGWQTVAERVAKLTAGVFPQEVKMAYPTVDC